MNRWAIYLLILSGVFLTMTTQPAAAEHRIEEQYRGLREVLKGKRVGLLTNPTGVDQNLQPLADRMSADPEIDLVCFFAPEHGLRGDQQAGSGEADYVDSPTGLPVYSIYGSRQAPTAEQLASVDVVVFDIQDVGTRFYTFVWSMTHAMEAAAAAGTGFVVFDRPNPVGLDKVEGAPNTNNEGLIGRKWAKAPFGVSTRHGLTAGELATIVNEEWMEPKVKLTVVAVPRYTRSRTFEETGYPWVLPSPNMPTRDTAVVYPGMGIFEGTNLSEGRGTTRPFEFCGAPFIDATAFAEKLNSLALPGVRFRALYFSPTFSKHAGAQCGGVQVHVTDTEKFEPVRTGLSVLKTVCTMYPDKVEVKVWASRLMGTDNLHERIRSESVDAIISGWQDNLSAYLAMRKKHLLYPEAAN